MQEETQQPPAPPSSTYAPEVPRPFLSWKTINDLDLSATGRRLARELLALYEYHSETVKRVGQINENINAIGTRLDQYAHRVNFIESWCLELEKRLQQQEAKMKELYVPTTPETVPLELPPL
jgi:hypothetical protein